MEQVLSRSSSSERFATHYSISSSVRSEIWMPYGDIILQVQSTQFRVNRDILAKHSPVFRDLFSVPQPPHQGTVEGCHVVQLSDAAEDWALLLDVLYEPFQHSAMPSFNVLAAMLRLGRKYEIQQAHEDAASRIRYEFPADFRAFNDLNADMTRIKYHEGIYSDLLSLAYECGIYSSVPLLAFCCLRTYKLETLFNGVQRQGSRSFVMLPENFKIPMALALERMVLFQHASLSWLRNDSVVPHAACLSPIRCAQQQSAMARIVDEDQDHDKFNLGYTVDQWDDRWTGMLCGSCERVAEAMYELDRARGWELLPTFFGLPEWKDLRDVD
ncbi:hypothetical protein C8R43DRAFT_1079683 [Mycena crocata]|nr:hypothetical protein C8R43DRAFT_1079683 [Mycena crocata]